MEGGDSPGMRFNAVLPAKLSGMGYRTAFFTFLLGAAAVACSQQVPASGGMVYENHNQTDYKAITLRAVTGKAHDEQGVAIPNVSLGLFTEKDHRLVVTAESAADGTFKFADVAPGLYRLVAKYDGLCPANVPIRLTRHASVSRSVDLHMEPRGLDDCSYGTQAPKVALKTAHAGQ